MAKIAKKLAFSKSDFKYYNIEIEIYKETEEGHMSSLHSDDTFFFLLLYPGI